MGAIITLDMVPNFVTCLPLYNEHCVKMLKMHRAGRQMILWKPVVYGHVSPCTMCTNTKVAPRRRTNHSMEPVVYGHCVKILKLHRDGRQIILLKPEVMCGHASPPCCCSSLTDFQSLQNSPHTGSERRPFWYPSFL